MVRDILCLVVSCDSEHTTEDNANIEEPTKYLSDTVFQTRLSLPQQLTPRDAATVSTMDAATSWGRANRSPRTYVQPSRNAGPVRRETTVTAGNTRMSSIPVFITPPGTRRRGQRADPSECTQPCPLAPFFRQQARSRALSSELRTRDGGQDSSSPQAAGVHELECATTPAGAV